MKLIVTGSLGNVSKPLTIDLVQKGHSVTVISSNPEKQVAIEALGATAAIGSMDDSEFLAKTFAGADAVYCMIPLSFTEPDQAAYSRRLVHSYSHALKQAAIKRVVVLSGWAADLVKDENLEGGFSDLTNASITYLRPGYFYSNFYNSIDMIKGKGIVGKFLTLRYSGLLALLTGKTGLLLGNFGGEDKIVFVSPKDIADAAAEELVSPAEKIKIRYVGSEEMTCNEAAKIIGTAVGKPWLKWVLISDKQMQKGLESFGMPTKLAASLVEMQAVMHSGAALQNYHKSKPTLGSVKLKGFAKEFAAVYNQK